MNNQQRKRIEKLLEQISDIKAEVESIRDEEQGKFDNMPENFQQGEKGQRLEEVVGNLDDAITDIESLEQNLNSANE